MAKLQAMKRSENGRSALARRSVVVSPSVSPSIWTPYICKPCRMLLRCRGVRPCAAGSASKTAAFAIAASSSDRLTTATGVAPASRSRALPASFSKSSSRTSPVSGLPRPSIKERWKGARNGLSHGPLASARCRAEAAANSRAWIRLPAFMAASRCLRLIVTNVQPPGCPADMVCHAGAEGKALFALALFVARDIVLLGRYLFFHDHAVCHHPHHHHSDDHPGATARRVSPAARRPARGGAVFSLIR